MKRIIRGVVLATVVTSALAMVSIAAPASYAADNLVERVFATRYADGVLSGTLTVSPTETVPPGSCLAPNPIVLHVGPADSQRSFFATTAEGTGEFAIAVELAPGDRYSLVAQEYFDPSAGWCEGVSTEGQTVQADFDGDGVADSTDVCPDVAGPGDAAYPGCPTLQRTVTATSAGSFISGQVSVQGPAAGPGTCMPSTVELFELTNSSERTLIGTAQTNTTGAYAIAVPGMQAGKSYLVAATAFLEDHAAFCAAAVSPVVRVPALDRDGDGVADSTDACPDVAGPGDAAYPGCPTLQRTVTATSAGSFISGQVSVQGPAAGPGTCMPSTVELFELTNSSERTLIGTAQTNTTGAYAIAVPGMQAGKSYLVAATAFLEDHAAFCAAAVSPVVRVPALDRDGDGVADSTDVCPDVAGSPDGVSAGCPTFGRSVDVSYKSGKIFGTVSSAGQVTVGSKSTAPCADALVTVWMRDGAGVVTRLGAATTSSGPKSDFKLAVGNLRFGNTYWAVAEASSAAPLAYCMSATSPTRIVIG